MAFCSHFPDWLVFVVGTELDWKVIHQLQSGLGWRQGKRILNLFRNLTTDIAKTFSITRLGKFYT